MVGSIIFWSVLRARFIERARRIKEREGECGYDAPNSINSLYASYCLRSMITINIALIAIMSAKSINDPIAMFIINSSIFFWFLFFFFLFALAEYLVVVILVCVWFIFCSWPSARSFSIHDSISSSLL